MEKHAGISLRTEETGQRAGPGEGGGKDQTQERGWSSAGEHVHARRVGGRTGEVTVARKRQTLATEEEEVPRWPMSSQLLQRLRSLYQDPVRKYETSEERAPGEARAHTHTHTHGVSLADLQSHYILHLFTWRSGLLGQFPRFRNFRTIRQTG